MSLITVIFGDQEVRSAGQEISFGRSTDASLKLDRAEADRSLSRFAGTASFADNQWVLTNTASQGRLEVLIDGGAQAVLDPGTAPFPLPPPCHATLRVRTVKDYVLDVIVQGEFLDIRLPEAEGGTTTVNVADYLELTDRERLFLAALAEPRLTNPHAQAWTIPSTEALRERLDLSAKQIEKLLDSLAIKMQPYLGDLIGSNSGRSNTRRFQIVDFAIRTGSVTVGDLRLIDRLPRSE